MNAWATLLADAPDEWIELTFANPVRASGVRVRQNFNPGAISRVDLLDAEGQSQTVFQGPDTNAYPRASIGWLSVRFPITAKPVTRVRLALDSVRVPGWNEIDAVQLVAGALDPLTPPRLVFAPRDTGSSDLTILWWPEGFRLEHATRISPPDWTQFAERPPATIPIGAASGFFRLTSPP